MWSVLRASSVTTLGDEGKWLLQKPFNSQVNNWPTYNERLQYYFVANDVKTTQRRSEPYF